MMLLLVAPPQRRRRPALTHQVLHPTVVLSTLDQEQAAAVPETATRGPHLPSRTSEHPGLELSRERRSLTSNRWCSCRSTFIRPRCQRSLRFPLQLHRPCRGPARGRPEVSLKGQKGSSRYTGYNQSVKGLRVHAAAGKLLS